jgi:large subunit ribosomal protein L24
MKLRKGDQIVVLSGRDKGKTGEILVIMPAVNKIVVEGINVVKRHTKPSAKQPRGGILEIAKPMPSSKVMVLDPSTKQPARISYDFTKSGEKQRLFRPAQLKVAKTKAKPAEVKTDKAEPKAKAATKGDK